jgi:hypothetical protein
MPPEIVSREFLLGARLSATQESIKRTRFALLSCIAISLASLVCAWNTFESIDFWDSFRVGLPPRCSDPNVTNRNAFCYDSPRQNYPVGEPTPIEKEIALRLADNWVDSNYLNLPIFGLRVSVSDFWLYDTLATLFILLYLLLSARRENREIGWLLYDLQEDKYGFGNEPGVCKSVYRSIAAYMVFNLFTKDDAGFAKLSDIGRSLRRQANGDESGMPQTHDLKQGRVTGVRRALRWMRRTWRDFAQSFSRRDEIDALRAVVKLLFFLPPISISFNFFWNLMIIFRSDVFHWGNTHLLSIVIGGGLFELLSLVYIFYLAGKALKFHNQTGAILVEFRNIHNA